ncbi:MAG: hypothetical protein ACR2G7_05950 [Acidimicrobiales bacterium]
MGHQTEPGADERRLGRSSALAGVGDGIAAVALPLLVAGLTRDPLTVAGVVAAQHAPWVVVAVVGPVVVGDADRRTVLGLAATLRAVAVAVVGVAALAGSASLLVVGAAAVALGIGEALADGAEEEAGTLRAAHPSALRLRGMVGLAVVGLPLGGVIYQIAPGLPFLFAVGVFSPAALWALSLERRLGGAGAGATKTAAAVAAPALAPGTGVVVTAAMVATGASSAVLGVLVLFALDGLGLGAPAFGLLLAGLAAAVAVGGLTAPTVVQLLGLGRGVVVALAVAGTGYIAAGVVSDPARPLLGALALGVGAGAGMVADVLMRAMLHARPVIEGDPLAGFHLRVWAAIPVGALVGGVVAKLFGVAEVVVGAGVVSVVTGLLALRSGALPAGPVVASIGSAQKRSTSTRKSARGSVKKRS